MAMINTIQERLRIPALLLAAFSLIALAGCGSDAPRGSTITVAADGSPVILDPVTIPTFTSPTTKTQYYRVTVVDELGQPLNDIDVNFLGQFTHGQLINFGGIIGSAPTSTFFPGSVTLSTTQKTDKFGYFRFAVSVPYYAAGIQLSYPTNQTITPSATGGNLADDTYSYKITSLDIAGETTAGGSISAIVTNVTPTTATGSVALSWKAVPGATSYNVYGKGTIAPNNGPIGYLVTILCPCPDPVTYTDQGQFFPQGVKTPPAINTTGLSLNSVVGTAEATTGSALTTFSISF